MPKVRTHYDNLRIARDAPDVVIRAAYKALLHQYHPDNFNGNEAEALRSAKAIMHSYEVLIDPLKRTEYDRWIDEHESDFIHHINETKSDTTTNQTEHELFQINDNRVGSRLAEPIDLSSVEAKSNLKKGKYATSWPRFLARIFDLWWEGIFFGTILALLLISTSDKFAELYAQPNSGLSFGILFLPVTLGIDAFLYRVFGNTPGKALLGLMVRNKDEKILSLKEYLYRNYLLWKSGLAFGIPLINLYALAKQGIRIKRGLQTTYDESNSFRVYALPITWSRKTVFFCLFISLFFVQSVLIFLDKNTPQYPRKTPISENPLHESNFSKIERLVGDQRLIKIRNNCAEAVDVAVTFWNGREWITKGWWSVTPSTVTNTGIYTSYKEIYAYGFSQSYKWQDESGNGFLRPIFNDDYSIASSDKLFKSSNENLASFFLVNNIIENSDSNGNYFEFSFMCEARENPATVSAPGTEEQHFAAIRNIHPDFLKINSDPNFQGWIDAQPAEERNNYQRIIKSGTANEVINMITAYKYFMTTLENRARSSQQDSLPSAKKECDIKPVMTDDDYRNCGMPIPRH